MLTLKNFELQISNKIVYRGREYYENVAVVDLEEKEEGLWYEEVMGSEGVSSTGADAFADAAGKTKSAT
jgi:hypothetical protein